jgi:hypothetical protein
MVKTRKLLFYWRCSGWSRCSAVPPRILSCTSDLLCSASSCYHERNWPSFRMAPMNIRNISFLSVIPRPHNARVNSTWLWSNIVWILQHDAHIGHHREWSLSDRFVQQHCHTEHNNVKLQKGGFYRSEHYSAGTATVRAVPASLWEIIWFIAW